VELLAKHRAEKADSPKNTFKKIEATKKVGRVIFKAKNTSLATMARVEGNIDGNPLLACLTQDPRLEQSRARL
jgi:hypothetical protein